MGFPASYEARALPELPGSGAVREFARGGRIGDGGVILEVTSGRGTWKGVVANAPTRNARALTVIVATPSPTEVCVVARGDAYFIDADHPYRWWTLGSVPVVAVRSAVDAGLLVFATPFHLAAVGTDGLAWQTSRLAIDGIELGEVAAAEIRGVADPGEPEAQPFSVDLRTGHHTGGQRLRE